MTTLSTLFHRGGPTLYWITFLLGPSFVLCLWHAIRPARWRFLAGLAAVVVILGIGTFGTLQARGRADDHMPNPQEGTPASEVQRFRDEINAEANLPIKVAGAVAGGLAILLVIGQLRRRRR